MGLTSGRSIVPVLLATTPVVPPATSPYDTPLLPDGVGRIELTGTNYPFTVASSTISGINVSDTIADTTAMVAAIAAHGAVAPTYNAVVFRDSVQGAALPLIGSKSIWYEGGLTTNGSDTSYPTCCGSVIYIEYDASSGAVFTVKNFRTGPSDAAIALDPTIQASNGTYGQTFLVTGGLVNLINVIGRHGDFAGISSQPANTWLNRRNAKIRCYGCEFYYFGGGSGFHNTYTHDLAEFWFVRSYSHDAVTGHLLKNIGEKQIVVDSVFVKTTGLVSGSDTTAISDSCRASDDRWYDNLVIDNGGVGVDSSNGSWGTEYRTDMIGGFSLKFNPVCNVESATGNAREMRMTSSGGVGASTFLGTALAEAAIVGATSFVVRSYARYGSYQGVFAIDVGQTYRFRDMQSDGSILTLDAIPVESAGDYSPLTVPCSPLAKALSFGAPVVMALVVDGLDDTPDLNSKYWNIADPDYLFALGGKLRNGSGDFDLTKIEQNNTHFIQNLMIVNDRGGTTSTVLSVGTQIPQLMFWGVYGDAISQTGIPSAPINKPTGATGAWPNNGVAGSWVSGLTGSGLPYAGRNGSQVDWITPWPVFGSNIAYYKVNSNTVDELSAFGTTAPYQIDVRMVIGGVLTKLTTSTNALPKVLQTTLTAGAAAGSATVTLASVVGIVDGQSIMFEYPPKRGLSNDHKSAFFGTVVGAPSGNVVTLDHVTTRDAVSGARVIVRAAPGANPPYWITKDEAATR